MAKNFHFFLDKLFLINYITNINNETSEIMMTREQFRSLKTGDIVSIRGGEIILLVEELYLLGEEWGDIYEASGTILNSKYYKNLIGWHMCESDSWSYELIA